MTRGEWLIRELQDLWADLDGYAVHRAECPAAADPAGACECDLTQTRLHLREAAWAVLVHFGGHTRECFAHAGEKCNCGLANARRRLEAVISSGQRTERSTPPNE